jgi:signal transduction histidine kinase
MSAVLLVDDSPADRALFRRILSRAGFEIHEIAYGREARAKALEIRPHIVVLDVNLPDTDGHAVCRELRADRSLAGLPVLMLTVRDNEADILTGLEAGADDYVPKDSAPEIILARIRRLISYRQMASLSVLNEQLVQIGRLLAGIVHEIRAPLSVIRGNAELMRLALGVEDESNRWIDPIIRNAQILQLRLEHLMAAVRSGPPVLQPIAIGPLVTEAADLFLKGTDPRNGKVVMVNTVDNALPPVLADPGRIIQVVLNLIANSHEAIAEKRRGGTIRLSGERVEEEGRSWVRIDVTDDGPGIPETILDRLFEPFFTTKSAGSGYGLYLASEIVREHGGRMTARNVPEGGACFSIWLTPANLSEDLSRDET